ncbi:hypothetical protein [Pseudomonas vanderleydeniana]|uniref:Chemotaxis protein n=1 Tax=Pseudomonas vanderleydeniana TaxID=2745495 RepID=A0A9E6PIT4_9PSED|nr:hypothetical protein [Pseudomonas vanderleydeniana]QXI26933.1 hypothetical protein HU752_023860 [Pseudomonas vanderleydeniana]
MTVIGNSPLAYGLGDSAMSPNSRAALAADKAGAAQQDNNQAKAADQDQEKATAPEGVKVSLSEEGKQKAGDPVMFGVSSEEYGDIEESGLPGKTQSMLKNIRDLQRKMAQLRAELEKIRNDKDLDPEIAQIKIANVTAALSGLSAALVKANGALEKVMDQDNLRPDARRLAQQLASPPR